MTDCMSSRIIVKNLPKHITEKRLSSHFGSKGSITDVKLMHTPSGVFRRFAFVGFSCLEEAQSAISFFHDTFIDTSRIEVFPARSVGDPDIPRAWSRHSAGSSMHIETRKRLDAEKETKRKAEADRIREEVSKKKAFLKSIYDGEEQDPDLAKFLAAHRPKTKTRTWENDGELVFKGEQEAPKKKPKRLKVVPVLNKKPGGDGLLVTKTHVTFDSEGEDAINNESRALAESSDEDYEDFIPRGPVDSDEEESVISDKGEVQSEEISPMREIATPDLINETARLFVRNLSFSCTEQDLQALFESFGPLEEVHLSLSRESKRPKGYAYVKFVDANAAFRAFQQLDGTIFQGRLLHILPSQGRPAAKESGKVEGESYKDKKVARQKQRAGDDFNWNSLFVRSDTVLNSIASQLGISKADVMNPSSENLAIRLATAETHLISDTKRSLQSEGVDLSVFEEKTTVKSKSIIIVKNFPFETERSELSRLFGKFGPIGRIIFPQSKAIAIIEFLEANDAKSAFRTLAYSRFHSSPLFLEYAPEGILKGPPVVQSGVQTVVVTDSVIDDPHDDDGRGQNNDTLYVKNINFDTVESTLSSIFTTIGPLKAVTIPRKRDPKKPESGLLSMGFAFVQFEKSEHASLALDRLQGTLIDGHSIVLKRSSNTSTLKTSASGKKERKDSKSHSESNPTLIVRNIPFEASEREVRELFRNFAQVKRVRVPRKFDGGHRGFGFVEFMNSQEARNAMSLLAHTHLYGRHLVIDWADKKNDDDDSVGDLRDKAVRNARVLGGLNVGNNIDDMLNEKE